MARIILKNGREIYSNESLSDWDDLNEKPQFIKLKVVEISRSKGLGDDSEWEVEIIINKDHIAEINE